MGRSPAELSYCQYLLIGLGCGEVGLMAFLTHVSQPETQRGGTGDKAFLTFKLHRFIAGSGEVVAAARNGQDPASD